MGSSLTQNSKGLITGLSKYLKSQLPPFFIGGGLEILCETEPIFLSANYVYTSIFCDWWFLRNSTKILVVTKSVEDSRLLDFAPFRHILAQSLALSNGMDRDLKFVRNCVYCYTNKWYFLLVFSVTNGSWETALKLIISESVEAGIDFRLRSPHAHFGSSPGSPSYIDRGWKWCLYKYFLWAMILEK